MQTVLVIRLSSMGDALLTLPVIRGILGNHPDVQLVFVTRRKFIPYFEWIERLILVPFDPEGRHKGVAGVWKLYTDLRRYPFKKVIDLQGSLRTFGLKIMFRLSGSRIYRIGKHRKLRRKIIKEKVPGLKVPHAIDRYLNVFSQAGLTGILPDKAIINHGIPVRTVRTPSDPVRIGIAPLSKHPTKNWGLQNLTELIRLLRLKYLVEIHLFGGSEDEALLNPFECPGVLNHAGRMSPSEEIALVLTLDLFVSMDSANMHLASLAGIPTLSIWGATDPSLGFAAWHQPDDYSLFADPAAAYCRPCSVYGEKPCMRKDAPMVCMTSIRPEKVMNKIGAILK